MTTKQKSYIALAVTSIVWGTSWIASRIAVQQVPAFEVAAIRQFIAGTLFAGFFLVKGEKLPSLQQLKWMAGMSVLLFVAANGLATMGVQYISSGLAALIAALYPLSVVIIERVFYKNTKITGFTFLGILLGISGIGLVFYEHTFHTQNPGYWIGVGVSILAMLSWSVGTIFIARKKMNINPYYATGVQMFFASFILLAIALISGKTIPVSQIPLKTWLAIAYLVVFGSILAFIAFIYTMKYLEPSIAALYAYINPIVATIIGSFLIKEALTLNILLGSLITLIGVYIVNQSLRKQRKALVEPIE